MNDKNLAKAYKIVVGMMVLFFATAIGSSLLGKYIDAQFNSYPYGFIGCMFLSYLISFGLAYKYYVTNYKQPADDNA